NSTAKGGGVAEMLSSLTGYLAGAGIRSRWLVVEGDDEFFALTKGIHNRLHGADDGGGRLDGDARARSEPSLAAEARDGVDRSGPGGGRAALDRRLLTQEPVAGTGCGRRHPLRGRDRGPAGRPGTRFRPPGRQPRRGPPPGPDDRGPPGPSGRPGGGAGLP